jgi:hypothetical protein
MLREQAIGSGPIKGLKEKDEPGFAIAPILLQCSLKLD